MTLRSIYKPGLISILFLPLLFLVFLLTKRAFDIPYAIELNLFTPKTMALDDGLFSPYMIENGYPERNYTQITIAGNKNTNNKALAYAQLEIRQLLADKDTLRGVHFKFLKGTKYNDFIKSLNILKKEEARQYIVNGDDIWVYNLLPKNSEKPIVMFLGSYLVNVSFNEDQGNPFFIFLDHTWVVIKEGVTCFWPSFLILTSMVYFSIKEGYFIPN